MRGRSFPIIILFTLAAPHAFAAGSSLREASADAMAAAYAGAAATSTDPSYLAYNPAALAGVEDFDLSLSATAILPTSRGSYTVATTSAGNPTGGDLQPTGYIKGATIPSFAMRQRLSDDVAVGIDVSVPWGLNTDYRRGWAGRYYAGKTELKTIDVMPTLSWQPLPGLALGAGLQVELAQGKLSSTIDTGTLGASIGVPGSVPGAQDSGAVLSAQNWSLGYTLGMMATLSEGFVFGVSYRSAMNHDLQGPLTFTPDSAGIAAAISAATGAFTNTRGTASLRLPGIVSVGLRDRLSEDWFALAELDWTRWSRFRELRITAANPAQPDDFTTTHWQNALFGALGLEYRASHLWTFRGGVAYDQTPVPDATREPRFPDSDRIWLSIGARYRLNDAIDVMATASHVFFPEAAVRLTPAIPGAELRGTLLGRTEAESNVIGVQLTYRASQP
jgi:long-chain fatty acid transport protein